MAEVILQNVSKRYGDHSVIAGLDFAVRDGEFVSLLGPSGCGKSTLLRMIAGLEHIDGGDLLINGKRYNDLPPQKRRIAMVFQSYALFPHMSVAKNIAFGLTINKMCKADIEKKIDWVVPLLNLDDLEKRFPRELSGGQRQRVALARALVLDPDVLLLDEPLSNLDAALRDMAMEELKRIHLKVGKTIIYVTHNQIEATTMSSRIALMNSGNIEQYDTTRALYDRPRTVFASEFIGSPSINFIDGEIVRNEAELGIRSLAGYISLDQERWRFAIPFIGKKVLIGIRPQNIFLVEHLSSRRSSDTRIPLIIELIEEMGDRCLMVGRGPENIIIRFLISREAQILPGQTVTVYIDGRRVHLFDPKTRQNICTTQS